MTTKDSYEIIQHNIRVSKMAEAFAHSLNLSQEQCEMVAVAGVFIDLGKIAMDFKVFAKTTPLSEDEFEYVKQHSAKSTQMLIQSHLISREILSCIIHHHENYDGSGYPSKARGETIPLGARILKICDVYDALMESRPYRKPHNKQEALSVMEQEKERFDPELLEAFQTFIQHYRH